MKNFLVLWRNIASAEGYVRLGKPSRHSKALPLDNDTRQATA
jgi:hypothetical protein